MSEQVTEEDWRKENERLSYELYETKMELLNLNNQGWSWRDAKNREVAKLKEENERLKKKNAKLQQEIAIYKGMGDTILKLRDRIRILLQRLEKIKQIAEEDL